MDIKPIKTERDYHRSLKEIESLMNAEHNTPEGDRLDVLVTLVEAWEAKHDVPAAAIRRHGDEESIGAAGLRPRPDQEKVARVPNEFQIRAIAFQEGDVWVVQGIEYDIAAHASDPAKVPAAFTRAILENVAISKHLGRKPLEGIKPAPERYREMFDRASTEVRPVELTEDSSPPLIAAMDIRLAEIA